MSIRNRLLLLLLAIALTPLVVTSVLQQVSIRMVRARLASRMCEELDSEARQALQEQLNSHVEILERDRHLTDALLRRQVREVELRLAHLPVPPTSVRTPSRMDRPRFAPGPDRGASGGGDGAPNAKEDVGDPGTRIGSVERGAAAPGTANRPIGRRNRSAPSPVPDGRGKKANQEIGVPRGGPPFVPVVEMARVDYQFGADPNLTGPSVPHNPSLAGTSDPNAHRLTVNYRAQSCFVMRDSNETWTKPALETLAMLTPVYEEICTHGPRGILWLHTSLAIGVHTTYPGGVGPREPSRYDPRRDDWYRRAHAISQRPSEPGRGNPAPDREATPPPGSGGPPLGRGPFGPDSRQAAAYFRTRTTAEVTQGVPSVDPFTGQPVVVRSMPVHYADGSFAGVTALVRTIPEIFASMRLPQRWGNGIERMLILVDPNAPRPEMKVQVLLHDGLDQDQTLRGRRRRNLMGELRSEDTQELGKVVDDVSKGTSGVRVIEDKGRMYLWAYQPLDIPQVAALLIVPYDGVVKLAQTIERSLLEESLFWPGRCDDDFACGRSRSHRPGGLESEKLDQSDPRFDRGRQEAGQRRLRCARRD